MILRRSKMEEGPEARKNTRRENDGYLEDSHQLRLHQGQIIHTAVIYE